jgi:1,2-diacylglycerol 3-alpha-glucosyltransferase
MARAPLPEKLNICITSRNFPVASRSDHHGYLWPIVRGLSERGHHVTILSSTNPLGKAEIVDSGVHAYYLNEGVVTSPSPFGELLKSKFLDHHNKEPFHILHSMDSSAMLLGKNKKDHHIAIAYDVEATQMGQVFSILGMAQESFSSIFTTGLALAYKFLTTFFGGDRKLLKTADGVFVTSPQQRISLERYYLYPDSRVYTVPYGIEVRNFEPRPKSESLLKELGLPVNAQVIVTLTDMTELEEVKNLLVAFQKVAIKKPNTRLIIIGQGPLKHQIEYEMLSLALGSRVIFAGPVHVDHLSDYISLCDVYIDLSARSSGFEPTMLEAMAQKKVIIGSEVNPIANIVEDGRDGFLVRPADTQSISTLLIDIFEFPLLSSEIGESARKKVIDLFDTGKMVDQTISAYKSILMRTGWYRS